MYILYARQGWGSALVEAQLDWYGLPYRLELVEDLFTSDAARAALGKVNPVAQVPALILPGGKVMTESAAITLHLADATGDISLVPPPGDAARPDFLRWLVFLVANIYPTFTFADKPSRYVPGEAAQKAFRASLDDYAQKLWRDADAAAAAPWFLGRRFSAVDIFVMVMTQWRPKRGWFNAHCPKLHAIALRAEAEPKLQAAIKRNILPA